MRKRSQPALITKFCCYTAEKKYECLLFSFLLLIFGDSFTPHNRVAGVFDIYQNFLIGLFVFYDKKWLRHLIISILIVTVLLDVLELYLTAYDIRSWHGIIYLFFFALITREVFKEVLYAKQVSRELLAAALCGFVILCLMGTFLFYQIDIKSVNAFSNIGDRRDVLHNLNYFSFTTMLTIGYGDIVPLSMLAKRAVMMMGLIGHFYTVFITSIIIGKYLSVRKDASTFIYHSEKTTTEQSFLIKE